MKSPKRGEFNRNDREEPTKEKPRKRRPHGDMLKRKAADKPQGPR